MGINRHSTWTLSIHSFNFILSETTVKMFRYSVLLLTGLLCMTTAIQPGCRTRYEMRMKWAVQSGSGVYWECIRWGKAVMRSCPSGTLFSAPFQTCVPTKNWEAFPYYAPPTTTTDYADECSAPELCVNPCLDQEQTVCNGGVLIEDGTCACMPGSILENGTCVIKSETNVCGENAVWNSKTLVFVLLVMSTWTVGVSRPSESVLVHLRWRMCAERWTAIL